MAMVNRALLPAATTSAGAQRWPTGNQASDQPWRQLSLSISSDGGSQGCPSPSPCPPSRPALNVFRAAEAGDIGVVQRFLNGGGNANKAGKVSDLSFIFRVCCAFCILEMDTGPWRIYWTVKAFYSDTTEPSLCLRTTVPADGMSSTDGLART